MRSILLSSFLFLSLTLCAQDTIRVETLTFDSITARRGWWVFPDDTHHFRKVLMHHTLKCDPATTWDSYDCGEWDYLTYSFIHDHTGVLDSSSAQHPFFLVGTAAPDSVDQLTFYWSDRYQRWGKHAQILSVNTEETSLVGVGDTLESSALDYGGGTVRSQYIFTAGELSAAGVLPGQPIHQIQMQLPGAGGTVRLVVRTGATAFSTLTTFDEDLEAIYDDTITISTGDTLALILFQPILWDGSSNLLIDLAVENPIPLMGGTILASNMGAPIGVQQVGRDNYVEIGNDFIGVDPTPLAGLGNAITITFRCFGAPSLPQNTTMMEALDDQDRRILNIHLPWSDGHVYWDAGNDGTGYDRIDKATVPANIQGQWNDWAFVKNAATGSMKIYLNGALWHSGTGKTKPMNGITRFKIGADANGNLPWPGLLDDVNIFNTEVSAATISAWAGRRMDVSHPDHAALLYGFSMDQDQTEHAIWNTVDLAHPAWPMGTVRRDQRDATGLRTAPVQVNIRPDITFIQGDHVIQVDSTIVSDFIPGEHLSIEHYAISGNDAVPVDTLFGFLGRYYYTYDPDGTPIDSTYESGTLHVNDTLDYFGAPYEVVDDWEIGRYITPYGIGLTLGPNGFRWTYDVTDYQYLLHDSVELSAGNTQELMDLEFEMIEGTPPRELVRHQRPWGPQRSYSFGSLSDDSQLSPVTVGLDPAASQWTLRSRFTGHGDATSIPGVQGCCEFRDNTHYLDVNGAQVDQWHVWQTDDCALNPVYPQGGTWLYSREGWCPGDVVKDHMTELTPFVTGDSITLDYRITPVPVGNPGMAGGNYVVNMDLYEFGAATHALDAEIYDVKRPNDWGYRSRENPICYEPVVVLRNAGAQDLTSVTFTYHVSGGPAESHTWTGTLKHMESTEVILPVPTGNFWIGDSLHLFTVTVNSPNGGVDEYANNDSYTTHFELPVIYTDPVKVYYKTNNRPWDNEVVIKDMYGTAVYQKDWATLSANTVYTDTLDLTPGCYTLEMLDTGNDGLSYWADPGQGSGFLRLRKVSGATLKNFISEFGRSIHWAFAYNDIVGVEEIAEDLHVSVAPNPSDGQFTLITSEVEGTAVIEVFNSTGSQVKVFTAELTGLSHTAIDLSTMNDGMYLVRMNCEGRTAMARVIKQ